MSQPAKDEDFKANIYPLPERVANLSLPKEVPNWPTDDSDAYVMTPYNRIPPLTAIWNTVKLGAYLGKIYLSLMWKKANTPQERAKLRDYGMSLNAQLLKDLGIKVNHYGKTAKELGHDKILYVSNHISWLDGFVHLPRTKGRMVINEMVKKGLIAGKAYWDLALMPVTRGQELDNTKASVEKTQAKQIETETRARRYLNDPEENGLVLFPEGTISPGHKIITKPKRTIFHALFNKNKDHQITGPDDKAVVQPIAMIVRRVKGQDVPHGVNSNLRDQYIYCPAGPVAPFGHIIKHLIPTSYKGGIELDIYYLPPISVKEAYKQGFDTPAKLCDTAMLQIEKVIQNPPHLQTRQPHNNNLNL